MFHSSVSVNGYYSTLTSCKEGADVDRLGLGLYAALTKNNKRLIRCQKD